MPCGCCINGKYGAWLLQRRYSVCVPILKSSTHWNEPLIPGDVVVYSMRTQEIPIVHRVVTIQEKYFSFKEEPMETYLFSLRVITI